MKNHCKIPLNHYEIPLNHYKIPLNHYEIPLNHYKIPLNHYKIPLNQRVSPMAWSRPWPWRRLRSAGHETHEVRAQRGLAPLGRLATAALAQLRGSLAGGDDAQAAPHGKMLSYISISIYIYRDLCVWLNNIEYIYIYSILYRYMYLYIYILWKDEWFQIFSFKESIFSTDRKQRFQSQA